MLNQRPHLLLKLLLTLSLLLLAECASPMTTTGEILSCSKESQIKVLTTDRHCPSGVAEPTYAPSALSAMTSAISGTVTAAPSASASHSHDDQDDHHSHAVTAATCEPHNDHWHCPSGVAEPTTAPAQTRSASRATTVSGAGVSASASASPSQIAGSGAAVSTSHHGVMAIVLGAFGAFFLEM